MPTGDYDLTGEEIAARTNRNAHLREKREERFLYDMQVYEAEKKAGLYDFINKIPNPPPLPWDGVKNSQLKQNSLSQQSS